MTKPWPSPTHSTDIEHPAIDTRNLRKTYGPKVAVADLTLQVRHGETFGFLGPNGAGKTTSLKMLVGLVHPTSGSARVLGTPCADRITRRQLGFLPEHFRFHDWLTAREFLAYHGKLCGMGGPGLRDRVGDLLDLVGLSASSDQQLRTFSKGMLQRIGLAQALINSPTLVFLDEPTSGLDPAGRLLVRDIIRDLRNNDTTVFLNSHLLSEVESTCDRVAFIRNGEVVRVADLRELGKSEDRILIRAKGVSQEMLKGLSAWSKETVLKGEELSLVLKEADLTPQIVQYLVTEKAAVFAVTPKRPTLEELFVEIIGKSLET